MPTDAKFVLSAKDWGERDCFQGFYDFHVERLRKRVPLALMGLIGHLAAVLRHHVSYAELLRIRYAAFPTLIVVGTEDRLVRETNSFLLQRVRSCFFFWRLDVAILVGHRLSTHSTRRCWTWSAIRMRRRAQRTSIE